LAIGLSEIGTGFYCDGAPHSLGFTGAVCNKTGNAAVSFDATTTVHDDGASGRLGAITIHESGISEEN
jgi:hypothetical protein